MCDKNSCNPLKDYKVKANKSQSVCVFVVLAEHSEASSVQLKSRPNCHGQVGLNLSINITIIFMDVQKY